MTDLLWAIFSPLSASGLLSFQQSADTVATMLGILTGAGMMLLFIYKNRTLGLQNEREIARMDRDHRERYTALETRLREADAKHEERMLALQARVNETQIELAKIEGSITRRTHEAKS